MMTAMNWLPAGYVAPPFAPIATGRSVLVTGNRLLVSLGIVASVVGVRLERITKGYKSPESSISRVSEESKKTP